MSLKSCEPEAYQWKRGISIHYSLLFKTPALFLILSCDIFWINYT